jgi:hypothetical protein
MHEGALVSIRLVLRYYLSPKLTSARYECVSYPNTSLHLTRSRIEHDKRRKIWDRGFSAKCQSAGRLLIRHAYLTFQR